MYRANQKALLQQTNQGVISIRQAEISYYTGVSSALGTQAALIGGFTYGIFTQNNLNHSYEYTTATSSAYYTLVAVTIASAVHVILTSMLLQVLGPGLALNGPAGSMAQATEGMRAEQGSIVISFMIMMLAFATSTVLLFWSVFDQPSAIASSFVFLIAARQWYYYCRRIYVRFHWDDRVSGWGTEGRESGDFGGEDDDKFAKITEQLVNSNPLHEPTRSTEKVQSSTIAGEGKVGGEKRRKSSILDTFRSKSKASEDTVVTSDHESHKTDPHSSNSHERPTSLQHRSSVVLARNNISMEGYLSKRGGDKVDGSSSGVTKNGWWRRYFVMSNTGDIYYYKTRQDFRRDRKSHVLERPIRLSQYFVTSQSGADATEVESVSETILQTLTVTSASGVEGGIPKFQITLRAREEGDYFRKWVLRTDTEEEMEIWLSVMRELSPSSFRIEVD